MGKRRYFMLSSSMQIKYSWVGLSLVWIIESARSHVAPYSTVMTTRTIDTKHKESPNRTWQNKNKQTRHQINEQNTHTHTTNKRFKELQIFRFENMWKIVCHAFFSTYSTHCCFHFLYFQWERFTCRPRNVHSHQPSRPSVSCSMTVNKSPRLNANSSGVSAILS